MFKVNSRNTRQKCHMFKVIIKDTITKLFTPYFARFSSVSTTALNR